MQCLDAEIGPPAPAKAVDADAAYADDEEGEAYYEDVACPSQDPVNQHVDDLEGNVGQSTESGTGKLFVSCGSSASVPTSAACVAIGPRTLVVVVGQLGVEVWRLGPRGYSSKFPSTRIT